MGGGGDRDDKGTFDHEMNEVKDQATQTPGAVEEGKAGAWESMGKERREDLRGPVTPAEMQV